MSIVSQELKLYKSSVVNDTTSNGGRLSAVEAVSGVKNNVFPDVINSERISGITRFRKLHYKVDNDADLLGSNAHLCLADITPGDSRVVIFKSANNARDTQGSLTGSERVYGVGRLNADVIATDTVLVVNAETNAGADLIFQDGDTVYVNDNITGEFATIATGGVSWVGDQATITLTAGLNNSYSAAAPTKVSACIDQALVQTITDNWVETSASGTYDEATTPLITDFIGTVEQTWTLTFSSSSNFSVVGDTLGSVGSGDITTAFSPSNPDFSKPYFTLDPAGFAGTWANGDTIVFETHPATIDFWAKMIVEAGAASQPTDQFDFFLDIQSS